MTCLIVAYISHTGPEVIRSFSEIFERSKEVTVSQAGKPKALHVDKEVVKRTTSTHDWTDEGLISTTLWNNTFQEEWISGEFTINIPVDV
jgi:hypothetical protein